MSDWLHLHLRFHWLHWGIKRTKAFQKKQKGAINKEGGREGRGKRERFWEKRNEISLHEFKLKIEDNIYKVTVVKR